MKGNVVGQGGLKVIPKPIIKTFKANENLQKNDSLQFVTDVAGKYGNVAKALTNIEYKSQGDIGTTAQSGGVKTAKLTDSTHLVVYRSSSGQYPMAHVATLNEVDGTYSKGAEVYVEGVTCVLSDVIALSPTKAIVFYEAASTIKMRVLNISGTTITLGATAYSTASMADKSYAAMLNSGKFILFGRSGTNGVVVIGTVSGDVITLGTPQTWQTVNSPVEITINVISDTKCVITYLTTVWNLNARVLNITGTVVTFETNVVLFTDVSYTITTAVSAFARGFEYMVVLYKTSASNLKIKFLTVTNNSITQSSEFDTLTNIDVMNMCVISETVFVVNINGQAPRVFTKITELDVRFGKYQNATIPSTGSKIVSIDNKTIVLWYAPNGGSVQYRYNYVSKYVSAIANENATANANISCLML